MASPVSYLDDLIRRVGDAGTIRAYHGSPHDFDRFDASKIGTGEGAQKYGYGLYFGGAKKTGDFYKETLADLVPFESPEQVAAAYLHDWGASSGGSPDVALSKLREHARDPYAYGYDFPQGQMVRKALELLKRGEQITPRGRTGHLYEVEIPYPEKALLDYDATLDTQPQMLPGVERAMRQIKDPVARDDMMVLVEDPSFAKGKEVYGSLRNEFAKQAGLGVDDARFDVVGGTQASRALLDAGIPGMRYLDGFSRSAGQGTRNYVVFPGAENSIRILRKLGLMAPMAAASQGEE